ncbi:MAG: GNAT family N-acetyltransferase [Acidimicrobiia bacterium]|nr:GNAT family N-acetyltransferase [Acidimicrobiia bacterium]
MDQHFRKATGSDLDLVKQTLYLALSWDPADPIPPFDQVVDHPEIAIYHRDWMRRGDAGVVAEFGGSFAGMAYYRMFSDDEHGQGFLDAATPELAIAVVPEHRGRGIGGRLLSLLHDAARRDGIEQISLSVHAGNPAGHLYERHGYMPAPGDDDELMVVRLGPHTGEA